RMKPGTCQTEVSGFAQSDDDQPSRRLSRTPADIDRVDGVFRDVLSNGAFRDVRRAAHVDKADAPLSDKPTYEARCCAERIDCLVAAKQPLQRLLGASHRTCQPS